VKEGEGGNEKKYQRIRKKIEEGKKQRKRKRREKKGKGRQKG
jgi:hypothetical protein